MIGVGWRCHEPAPVVPGDPWNILRAINGAPRSVIASYLDCVETFVALV